MGHVFYKKETTSATYSACQVTVHRTIFERHSLFINCYTLYKHLHIANVCTCVWTYVRPSVRTYIHTYIHYLFSNLQSSRTANFFELPNVVKMNKINKCSANRVELWDGHSCTTRTIQCNAALKHSIIYRFHLAARAYADNAQVTSKRGINSVELRNGHSCTARTIQWNTALRLLASHAVDF